VRKPSSLKVVCMVFAFCAAAAVVAPAQTLTTLYSFCSQNNCTDGFAPEAGLVQGTDGNFYGTTEYGGAYNDGAVFKITPGGTLTTLHSFSGSDGQWPHAGLVQGGDGNFYGTTERGGASGRGTVFKINPNGTLSTLYSFCPNGGKCADGYYPDAGLVQATDGNFYGTTIFGGASGYGTVFKITASGALTTLHSFNYTDGVSPEAGLVQASDGNFYGTTSGGGAGIAGTAFQITAAGTLTTLYSFCSQNNCTDGFAPEAGLVQGTDGNFYGTTAGGGTSNNCVEGCGTVFKITPGGTLTTLHGFSGADGANPYAGLVQATDGNFYGTTVFKITSGGTLTTLYSFCSQNSCTDGLAPEAGLVQATDGNFYGTTLDGGAIGVGTVFKLSVGIDLSPVQFVPVTPCRLLDTRPQYGGNGPIQGGTFEFFNLPQLAELGKNCPPFSLSSASAYSLNVTVVPEEGLGYLTIWPAGRPQPFVSTMNSLDGRIKANAAIVPAGASQAVSVFVTNTTDLVLDIDGYFAPTNGSTLDFYTLPPCRVADTRNPNGPLGGPYLTGGKPRNFPVLQSTCFPTGLNPSVYSFNVTAVPRNGQPLGYVTVWPAGQSQPLVSTLNDGTGTVVANAAIVVAGSGGDIDVFASNNTDIVIDVNGYFAPSGGSNALQLYPVAPCRVLDTRNGNGAFSGELTVGVAGSPCAPASTAQAYVFNATVVPSGPLGYLTLWPDCLDQPGVSTLNAVDGTVTSNLAIVPNSDGSTDAYASSLTHLVLDLFGYFAP